MSPRTWAPETIPDSTVLPEGAILFTIEDIIEERTNEGDRLMYNFHFRAQEPPAVASLMHFERFTIGSPEDPEAEDPDTWAKSIGARIMKQVLKASQVELGEDLDEVFGAAKGQNVIGIVTQQVDDGSRDPKYKGQIRNRVQRWYAPGEREVALNGPAAAAPTALKPKPGAAKAAPPAAKPAPAPAVATHPPSKPGPKAAPSAKPAEKTLTCTVCNEQVLKSQLAEHVEAHEGEE